MILPNPYIKLPRCYAPVYIPGQSTTIYINLDTPAVSMDETQYKLGLLGSGGLIQNVAPIVKDVLDDGTFNLYAQGFTFPAVPEDTCRFVVYKISGGSIIARSSLIQVNPREAAQCTLLQASNGMEDIYGYGFSRVPGLVLSANVPLFLTDTQTETDAKVYRNITNVATDRWRNLTGYEDDVYSCEAYYLDATGHQALRAMLNMSNVYFNHRRVQYKAGTYKVQTVYNLNVYKATFDFYALDEYNGAVPDSVVLPTSDYSLAYYQ